MPTESDILNVVKSQPCLTVREIAARLNANKAEEISILWKLQNRGVTCQDDTYRWYVVEKATAKLPQPQTESPKQLTTLGRVCR